MAIFTAVNIAYLCNKPDNEPTTPKIEERIHRARLLFAGDLMMHSPQLRVAQREDGSYDFYPMFEHVAPLFSNADYAVVNLETTLSENSFSGYPMFRSPREVAVALSRMGVDVATTANNHSCDGGREGVIVTAKTLDSLGIGRTGVFCDSLDYAERNPIRFSIDSISFALYAYTYSTNGMPIPHGCRVNLTDTTKMADDLRRADAEVVIVSIHWGDEYQRTPSQAQRQMADFIHRNGVDIIVGSHPHVIQPIEADSERITIYSLGNFISNQRWRYSNGGLLAQIDIEKGSDSNPQFTLTTHPVWVMMPDYKVVPRHVADTIEMDSDQRLLYEEFISDTDSLICGLHF